MLSKSQGTSQSEAHTAQGTARRVGTFIIQDNRASLASLQKKAVAEGGSAFKLIRDKASGPPAGSQSLLGLGMKLSTQKSNTNLLASLIQKATTEEARTGSAIQQAQSGSKASLASRLQARSGQTEVGKTTEKVGKGQTSSDQIKNVKSSSHHLAPQTSLEQLLKGENGTNCSSIAPPQTLFGRSAATYQIMQQLLNKSSMGVPRAVTGQTATSNIQLLALCGLASNFLKDSSHANEHENSNVSRPAPPLIEPTPQRPKANRQPARSSSDQQVTQVWNGIKKQEVESEQTPSQCGQVSGLAASLPLRNSMHSERSTTQAGSDEKMFKNLDYSDSGRPTGNIVMHSLELKNLSEGDCAMTESAKEVCQSGLDRCGGNYINSQPASDQSLASSCMSDGGRMTILNADKSPAGPQSAPQSPKGTVGNIAMVRKEAILSKIRKYWFKKQMRCTQKKVRYNCRQNLAKQRFRHQGRFITREEMEKLDPEQIYDPNTRFAPKVKQVFRISKEHHNNLSCRPAHSSSSHHRSPLLGACSGADLSKSSPASVGLSENQAEMKYLSSNVFKDANCEALIQQLGQEFSTKFLAQRMRLPSHQELQQRVPGLTFGTPGAIGLDPSTTDLYSQWSPHPSSQANGGVGGKPAMMVLASNAESADAEMQFEKSTIENSNIIARYARGLATVGLNDAPASDPCLGQNAAAAGMRGAGETAGDVTGGIMSETTCTVARSAGEPASYMANSQLAKAGCRLSDEADFCAKPEKSQTKSVRGELLNDDMQLNSANVQ